MHLGPRGLRGDSVRFTSTRRPRGDSRVPAAGGFGSHAPHREAYANVLELLVDVDRRRLAPRLDRVEGSAECLELVAELALTRNARRVLLVNARVRLVDLRATRRAFRVWRAWRVWRGVASVTSAVHAASVARLEKGTNVCGKFGKNGKNDKDGRDGKGARMAMTAGVADLVRRAVEA